MTTSLVYTGDVDWHTIHNEVFLYEGNCWTTCNGGFCCSNNHPDFKFQLMPTEGTTILYMEDEYEYLCQDGQVGEASLDWPEPQTMSLDYGGIRPLMIYHTPCRLLGLCEGKIDKPLLCKLYPFLPIFFADGRLETLAPASIFELTFEILASQTPCTIMSKAVAYLERWRYHPDQLAPLRHPYIMLYLQAVKHFAEIYREKLLTNKKLAGKTGKEFWSAWELQYLGGRLVDHGEWKMRVAASCRELTDRYGEFLAPKESIPQ